MDWINQSLPTLFLKTKRTVKILIALLIFLFAANITLANFGISPPFVKNHHLLPDSHFEQKIVISRAEPKEDLRVEATINAPEMEGWITIDKGLSFILPKGQQQVPIQVLVDVPQDVGSGNYQGKIDLKTIPIGTTEEGTVTVVTGGQIRIELTVSGEEFSDFKVRTFGISKLKEGQSVKVSMNIENTGNVATTPSKVHLDVYDKNHLNLLGSVDDSNLETVEGFKTKEISAEFPIELGVDYYWGEVKIFKGEEIIKSGKIYFEVVEKGTLKEEVLPAATELTKERGAYLYRFGAGLFFLLFIALLIWLKKQRGKISFKVSKKK